MAIGGRIQSTSIVGKSKKQKKGDFFHSSPQFSFDDMIINKKAYHQIQDAISLKKYQDLIYSEWGLEKTHKYEKKMGICLYGPPGTGKTMAAHAIADQLNNNLLIVNYADIESKYVGETSKNLVKIFDIVKKNQLILFFDEADAMLSKRVTEMRHSSDVSVNQTRSVLLMLLNDYSGDIIFATNFIANIDPAFIRRIGTSVFLDLPNKNERKKLFEKYLPEKLPHDIHIEEIVNKYSGISGSDISNVILMSAIHAARNNTIITNDILESKIKQILSSKKSNNSNSLKIKDRIVSEKYALNKLNS